MSRPHSPSCCAFSLLEVVIVIFILAAFMALAVPIVIAAREAGKLAACLSNLAQIGNAARIYATANQDWVLRNGTVGNLEQVHRPWLLMVNPAMRDRSLAQMSHASCEVKVLKCPAHPDRNTPTNYIVNAFAILDTPLTRGDEVAGPTRLSKVKNSSNVIFVADLDSGHLEWIDTLNYLPERDDVLWMITVDVWRATMLPGFAGPERHRIPRSRHGKDLVNALFFDGSARSVNSMKLTPRDFDDGIRSRHYRLVMHG